MSIIAKPPKKKKQKQRIELNTITVTPTNLITDYKASETRYFDLLQTTLYVEPILSDKSVKGAAILKLKPYAYPQQQLILDAKGMRINKVVLQQNNITIPLSYDYDSLQLTIILNKSYTKDEELNVLIEYIAYPYQLSNKIIQDFGRGMYFIDAENKNPYKPFHLWTQGEEEASSVWFPTIDATNERTAQDLYVTVDNEYTTLSNGLLIGSELNGNKRTDHWKQDKPHAPYLFFLGIGDYKKYSTSWRGKSVDYYTFPEYYKDVHHVFGNTPEMLEFFSNKLGVEFPWDKFAQIIAFDYTAGAMENSSAVIFYDRLLVSKQQLIDGNFDWIIAHELFHQWFGDLVTCESWANLTLNESLADYSEYLWAEYKYGKNDADAYNLESREKYFGQAITRNEPLVNYYYDSPHDNFDAIRYEKGGRILHMLRYYLGDDVFFDGLNKYLVENRYNSTEVSDFRKAFEQVSGEDLNWFFNQWYFSKGHPKVDMTYTYDAIQETIAITLKQTQTKNDAPIFKLPLFIDIYFKDTIQRKFIEIIDKEMTFYFPAKQQPIYINFDAEGTLLAEIDEHLTTTQQIYKFNHGKLYIDQYEVLSQTENLLKSDTSIQNLFIKALQHNDWNVQKLALTILQNNRITNNKNKLEDNLTQLIQQHPKSEIRNLALNLLHSYNKQQASNMALKVLEQDSSHICWASALTILRQQNFSDAYQHAVALQDTKSPILLQTIATIFSDTTINHIGFLKKAIYLNNYKTARNNYTSLYTFLKKCDDLTLYKDALNFLLEINQYEESDFNRDGAYNLVHRLEEYSDNQIKDKKLSASAIHQEKLKLIKEIISKLKQPQNQFSFH